MIYVQYLYRAAGCCRSQQTSWDLQEEESSEEPEPTIPVAKAAPANEDPRLWKQKVWSDDVLQPQKKKTSFFWR